MGTESVLLSVFSDGLLFVRKLYVVSSSSITGPPEHEGGIADMFVMSGACQQRCSSDMCIDSHDAV